MSISAPKIVKHANVMMEMVPFYIGMLNEVFGQLNFH